MRFQVALVSGLALAALGADVQQGRVARTIFSPAAFQDGAVPSLPVLSVAVGGGEVIAELSISSRGSVTAIRPLRVTGSFTEMVVDAAQTWRFRPAEEPVDPATRKPGEPATRRVASKVTVVAIFRPPSFYGNTRGMPIRDIASPAEDAPFPVSTTTPPFPPLALKPGVVLVEARVDGAGAVVGLKVIRSAPPFDEPAIDAARQWTFRPARRRGKPVTSLVYIMFGFQSPVT